MRRTSTRASVSQTLDLTTKVRPPSGDSSSASPLRVAAAEPGDHGSPVYIRVLPVVMAGSADESVITPTLPSAFTVLPPHQIARLAASANGGGWPAADVALLDCRSSKPLAMLRAVARIRSGGWDRGLVVIVSEQNLAKVPAAIGLGATDFVLPTTSPAELETRLRREAVRPRNRGSQDPAAPAEARIELHWRTHEVSFEQTRISLTLRELQLLDVFLHEGREIITAPELARLAWGKTRGSGGGLATTYVCSLRKKLAWFGGRFGIRTVRGIGYRFVI